MAGLIWQVRQPRLHCVSDESSTQTVNVEAGGGIRLKQMDAQGTARIPDVNEIVDGS